MASEIVPFIDKDQLTNMREFVEYLKTHSALPANENAGQVMMKLQAAKDMGLTPTQALTGIAFVNGKLAVFGAAAASLMVKHGYDLAWGECTDKSATLKVSKGDRSHSETFTIDDAKKAGLAGKAGPWTLYTRDMLRWKALARARNFFCPEVGGGLPIKEDYQETEKELTQAEPSKIAEAQANAKAAIDDAKKRRKAAKEAVATTQEAVQPEAQAFEDTDAEPEEKPATLLASRATVDALAKAMGGETWLKKAMRRAFGHDNVYALTQDQAEQLKKDLHPSHVQAVDATLAQVAEKEQAAGQVAKASTVEKLKAEWANPSLTEMVLSVRTPAALDLVCEKKLGRPGATAENLTPTETERMLTLVLERNAECPKK